MKNRNRILLALIIIVLAMLACGLAPAQPRQLNLYPSNTPLISQTPLIVVWTSTPEATQTPVIVVVVATTQPTTIKHLCVVAAEAVYLRPSPSDDNYPIMPLPKGVELLDLGGRSGNWLFVEYQDKQGWVHGGFVAGCP